MTTPKRHELVTWATHEVISGEVLRANDLTEGQVRTLLRREHLFRTAHRDIFFTTDPPSRRGIWLAAVLHLGKGALLGWDSAAALWQVMRDGLRASARHGAGPPGDQAAPSHPGPSLTHVERGGP